MAYGSGTGGGMPFGLLMAVGLILLAGLLIWAIGGWFQRDGGGRSDNSSGVSGSSESSAKRLLDERYARGELDPDEYLERLRVLGERD